MPLPPSEFSDRANVAISLLQHTRRLPAELGVAPRWNECPYRSTFTSLMRSFVDGPGVIRTVGGERCEGISDLPKQGRDLVRVTCPKSRQIRCDDLTCISVDSEVQLAPSPVTGWFLHMTDVDPEPCTVDEYVDRLIGRSPRKLNVAELFQTAGQRRVIGDREIELEEPDQASEKALRLSERELEDNANRQCGLDRDVRVGTLATGFAAGRSSPRIELDVQKPDGEVAPTPKAGLVLRPVSHPISRLCVLVLAALRILHG